MGALGDLRASVAGMLGQIAEVVAGAWTVHPNVVDAISPPAFMLVWADPWLARTAVCTYDARLSLLAVSARIEPDPGIEILESMVEAALGAITDPAVEVLAPFGFELGGLRYQAARITVHRPITLGG